jgi:3-hydroxyisobutyrate dehydrogenase-like beta-hydroxyacid dehydrogenase
MLVGIIGIESMSSPMGTNIAKIGHESTAFDVDGERSERFAEEQICKGAANIGEFPRNAR